VRATRAIPHPEEIMPVRPSRSLTLTPLPGSGRFVLASPAPRPAARPAPAAPARWGSGHARPGIIAAGARPARRA